MKEGMELTDTKVVDQSKRHDIAGGVKWIGFAEAMGRIPNGFGLIQIRSVKGAEPVACLSRIRPVVDVKFAGRFVVANQ